MRKRMVYVWVLLCLSVFLAAQNPPANLTDGDKAAVVDKLARILTEKYVFPETGQKMAGLIQANLKSGTYCPISDPPLFAEKLTEDILSLSHDKHLGVRYAPDMIRLAKTKTGDADELELLQRRQGRMRNYAFQEVRILPGNVGYLKFDGFSSDPEAYPVAIGALAFLANSDALIIDLRENGGGDPRMIQVITSYFFEGEPKHLNSFFYREGDITEQYWTLPYVPGQKMPRIPIFVLTSNMTFSGAEEFTYNLKNLKRATIVGETTGGGAHPVKQEFIDDNYWVSVPYARAVNPISKTNWEGTGVTPDIQVSADKAYDTALALALEKLGEGEPDARFKSVYLWHLESQKAKANPVTLAESDLQAYVGNYGPRHITLEDGHLCYQREGRPKLRMVPLGDDTFGLDTLTMFRVKFLREGGRVTVLEGRYEDGRKDQNPRQD